jgi:hypothetical protein
MNARISRLLLLALLGCAIAAPAVAERVTPSERVKSRLNVREQGSGGSRVVGALRPGDEVALLGTEQGWHRVRLPDGKVGFVSAGYTLVLPDPEPEVEEVPTPPVSLSAATPRPGAFARMGAFFRRLFGRGAAVDLVIAEPAAERSVYRHTDPNLPVAGFARARGAGRDYDVILVLDSSTSTNEFAGTDVDLDGEAEDEWKSDDSIYRAQISAATSFIRTLAVLPGNRGGERIRVGIVTCAGDDRFRLVPGDERLDINLETIRWLAHRDADVKLPLTHDYEAAEQRLQELWSEDPAGMTNVAAGIGRAVIELTGDSLRWARSEPREAEKLILFLSDGKPRLPYDKEKAERAASYAGRLASAYGIRINAFELGENVVSRSENVWLRRMALRTGGRHVGLHQPGEIVVALQTTPLSLVDRVKVRNRTTGAESPRIATGIDGSFYAEILLEEGDNLIQVEALLDDGDADSESFHIAYVKGVPTAQLEEELESVRAENQALLERIRGDLAGEIERARDAQQRRLELTVRDEEAAAE